MKNQKLQSFGVFCNRTVGERVKAIDFQDLLDNRMTNKQKRFWSEVKFTDTQERTICITQEFLEQGMTFDEIVQDWITHNPEWLDDIIHTIN